jgi:hypothetical protein
MLAVLAPVTGLASVSTLSNPWRWEGSLGFETNSFVRASVDRGVQSTTWRIAGSAEREFNPWLETRISLNVVGFDVDASSITPDLPEVYLSTREGRLGNQGISVGRRIFSWSKLDDRWRLGLWSPRMTWDPLSPTDVGNVGAFYRFKTGRWSLLAYGTPVSVPERSYPIRAEGGRLVSSSPYWQAPFEQVSVLGQPVAMNYTIAMPELSTLLLAPQAALSVTYRSEGGSWYRVNYGAGATHQASLAIDAALDLGSRRIEANLHPRRQLRQLATFEAGQVGDGWELWGSVSGEAVTAEALPKGWLGDAGGTSLFSAVGGALELGRGFRSELQYLSIDRVRENGAATSGDATTELAASSLPGRFQYNRAFETRLSWNGNSLIHYGASWLIDLADRGQRVSLDLSYVPGRNLAGPRAPRWSLKLGADLFFSETGRGIIGQQEGNDRLRGGLSYAF